MRSCSDTSFVRRNPCPAELSRTSAAQVERYRGGVVLCAVARASDVTDTSEAASGVEAARA